MTASDDGRDDWIYVVTDTQPEAWAAATTDPEPVPQVLSRFVSWVHELPGPRMFAAFPSPSTAAGSTTTSAASPGTD